MATTATASTATATTATGICQNGGTWLGEVCRCTHYFWGPRCEFVVNVIEVNTAVSAWIDVTVTVTNRRFVAALADPSTEEYRDFAREFTQQVGAIYRKVPEYHNTTVGQLRAVPRRLVHPVLRRGHRGRQRGDLRAGRPRRLRPPLLRPPHRGRVRVRHAVCAGPLGFAAVPARPVPGPHLGAAVLLPQHRGLLVPGG
ncbi:mucin-3A isoform X1 [Varanus komodoensis]|uniref:mucin-3A isoform X1 n=1 Tax=Varanus komodoensis TaxID=61221 RepID=UPI001CF7C1E7|nr:mucin-3A isoform X1 [Varanus komodoensis]